VTKLNFSLINIGGMDIFFSFYAELKTNTNSSLVPHKTRRKSLFYSISGISQVSTGIQAHLHFWIFH